VENLTIGEISERVKRSNDAVRSSLYRVKRMLIEAVDPALATAG
jgi:DNA-directed RNA polymerase specialized sigma24 family protein